MGQGTRFDKDLQHNKARPEELFQPGSKEHQQSITRAKSVRKTTLMCMRAKQLLMYTESDHLTARAYIFDPMQTVVHWTQSNN